MSSTAAERFRQSRQSRASKEILARERARRLERARLRAERRAALRLELSALLDDLEQLETLRALAYSHYAAATRTALRLRRRVEAIRARLDGLRGVP